MPSCSARTLSAAMAVAIIIVMITSTFLHKRVRLICNSPIQY
ncbi:hypothetical protein RMSM_00820 [Rhodopirellula maiorica SM1]|uniref:Uncharacterized protein n=1 Tax=Rhodopirellula maiorica SM1 TaxID=1265738 RepID=M5RSH8_9BACT|nr:hypothetical protein RMSM_00820 [Rhodopirellula maiorica SM1]